MNIFAVDRCPKISALHLHDRHVIKMILESAQMLSTAQRLYGNTNEQLYKSSFIKHPCTLWVCISEENYIWLYTHFKALCDEFKHRYNRYHKSSKLTSLLASIPSGMPSKELTDFVLAIPDIYKEENTVKSYRNYYLAEKIHNNCWTNRRIELDTWLTSFLQENQYKTMDFKHPLPYKEGDTPTEGEVFVFGSNVAGRHGNTLVLIT